MTAADTRAAIEDDQNLLRTVATICEQHWGNDHLEHAYEALVLLGFGNNTVYDDATFDELRFLSEHASYLAEEVSND